MVNIQALIGDARCLETIRAMRWPDGVRCPECGSAEATRDGRDDTQPERRRYRCQGCRKRFDDLTGTIFAGHHQPLRAWILCLYFMGLNLSNEQIARELGLDPDDALVMASQLREGIVERKPEVRLSGEVECDEVYVVAGHKGHPAAVVKRAARPATAAEGGPGPGHAGQGEAADLRDDPAGRRDRHPHAGRRQAADDRPRVGGVHRRVRHRRPTDAMGLHAPHGLPCRRGVRPG